MYRRIYWFKWSVIFCLRTTTDLEWDEVVMIVRVLTRNEHSVTLSQLVQRISAIMKFDTDAEESDHRLDRTIASGEIDKTFTMRKWSRPTWTRRILRHRLRSTLPSWRLQTLCQAGDYSCKISNSEKWRLPTHRSYCIGIIVSQAGCRWKEDLCHSQDESWTSCYWSQKTMNVLREFHGVFFM